MTTSNPVNPLKEEVERELKIWTGTPREIIVAQTNPKDKRSRYSELLIPIDHRWLCPLCPKVQVKTELSARFWNHGHQNEWVFVDHEEAFARFNHLCKDVRKEYYGVARDINRIPVAYFANLRRAHRCEHVWKDTDGGIGQCTFVRPNTDGDNFKPQRDYRKENLMNWVISVPTATAQDQNWECAMTWICPKCCVFAEDLSKPELENWSKWALTMTTTRFSKNIITGQYRQVRFSPWPTRDAVIDIFAWVNPHKSQYCENMNFGFGPLGKEFPCGYQYGTMPEFNKSDLQGGARVCTWPDLAAVRHLNPNYPTTPEINAYAIQAKQEQDLRDEAMKQQDNA